MVTSIHVLIYSPAGERIFEGRGGLGFVHELDLRSLGKKRDIFKLRDDLPGDIDSIRESIAIAFAPFLPVPPESLPAVRAMNIRIGSSPNFFAPMYR
jgi:hypothetical protein